MSDKSELDLFQLVHLTNMDLLVVSPVARNVNHSFILRTETVRSPMVRVCWAVSLDGKGRNVTKVKAQLFISTMYFIFVNCISKCINLVCVEY